MLRRRRGGRRRGEYGCRACLFFFFGALEESLFVFSLGWVGVSVWFVYGYEMIPPFFRISDTAASVLPATTSVQKSPANRSSSGSTPQFGLWFAFNHLKSSTLSHLFSCVSDHGGALSDG